MAQSVISEPVPISLISGRYLLFDVNVVTYLRRAHHICGSLIGSIPQVPQQNVFLGLPVELTPEEAKLLVVKEVAYIVDDVAWHKEKFNTFQGAEKQKYLDSLRATGLQARKLAQNVAKQRSQKALSRIAAQRAKKENDSIDEQTVEDASIDDAKSNADSEISLFGEDRPQSRSSGTAFASTSPYPVTPTTTYDASSLPQNPTSQPDPDVPSSYALFAHLHSRGYFIMPGLRFGCDYNVYPGDPLRFHSHFLATSYEFDQDIPMIDIIGGGRLGTAVKKGFLIGGKDIEADGEGDNVRTFCIEWGGM